jgi:hypothetical protein
MGLGSCDDKTNTLVASTTWLTTRQRGKHAILLTAEEYSIRCEEPNTAKDATTNSLNHATPTLVESKTCAKQQSEYRSSREHI